METIYLDRYILPVVGTKGFLKLLILLSEDRLKNLSFCNGRKVTAACTKCYGQKVFPEDTRCPKNIETRFYPLRV